MASVAPAIELDLISHGCCSDPTEINEEVPICGSDATKRECSTGQNAQALPSADGGRQAWSFLAACFLMEGVIWGLPFSFGVFQAYYSSHWPFEQQKGGIATIGATCMGVMMCSSPPVAILLQRWPWVRRPTMVAGLVIMVASMIAASFCDTIGGLIVAQGVLLGIGGSILYFPAAAMVDEWFIKRKGIAYGIMWSGTGSAGIVVPFLLQWLLDSYGHKSTFRIWAIATTILTIPCLYFVKPRLPTPAANAFRPRDYSFLRRSPFWFFFAGTVAQSLGVFIPSTWMPSFAIEIGLPSFAGPLSIAFYNLAFSIGVILLGILVDRYHVSVAITVSTIGSIIAAFVFWGLTNSQAMLYLFAILWGAFAGAFTATWTGSVVAIRRSEPNENVDIGIVIGLLAAGKGVGALVSGPLSEKLLHVSAAGLTTQGHFAYATPYATLVIFSGASAALGGIACVGRMLKML